MIKYEKGSDSSLTIGLFILTLFLSLFDIWISFGLVIHFGPIIIFFVTRALYKKHYKNQITELQTKQNTLINTKSNQI